MVINILAERGDKQAIEPLLELFGKTIFDSEHWQVEEALYKLGATREQWIKACKMALNSNIYVVFSTALSMLWEIDREDRSGLDNKVIFSSTSLTPSSLRTL